MNSRVLNTFVMAMVVACGPAGPVEGPEGEGDEDLIEEAEPWEGEPLEPVLIGSLPDENDPPIRQPGQKQDAGLHVIVDTPYQIWTGAGTYIHVGVWDESFEPADGARIFVDNDEVGKANKHGTLVFQYVPNKSDGYDSHTLWAVLDRGGKHHVGSVGFAAGRRTESFESANLFVYTDRGVFNPGQTIHIRAIAWSLRGEFTPLDHKEVELLLKNDRGRVVGGGSTETDGWGILSFDIPLPKHAPEGNYTLVTNFERESAEAKIRIERFVAPVIEIRHDLGRFLTRDQKTLPFEVNLGYFGGGTFESGKIDVKVTALGKDLHKEKRDVEGEGPFQFELDEKTLKKIRSGLYENDKVRIEIKVTDKFGRSDSVKRDMRYVTNPYVAVIIPDKEAYGEGDPVLVSVRIRDLDHVPIRGKEVKCVIGGETFKKKTDDDGVAEFKTKMGNTTLNVEAYMEGVDQPLAYSSLWFRSPPPMLSEIPGGKVGEREPTEIVVRFPGEYTPAEEVVHADVTDSSGSIVYGFEIPIKKEGKKYIAKTEFPAPSWGSMLITLYTLARKGEGSVGILADGQKLEVAPRKTIEIELSDVPKKAKPGQTIKVSAGFKNAQGKKIKATVGASVVDDAVISLLDPLEITPMDRFYNPELKVLSTTGATTLTWPVVSRNWGGALHDIAWCNWGYREGGSLVGSGGYGPMGGGAAGGGYYADEMMEAEEGYAMPMAAQAPAEPAPPPMSTPMPAKKAKKKSAGMTKSEAAYDFEDSSVSGELMKPGGTEAEPRPEVSITIRTDFSETSLWLPHIVAEKGRIEFETTLPDSITVQRLTLVASDKMGGSGVKHHKIKVEQKLYGRSDLPATLTLGDKIEVQAVLRNLTKKKVNATLVLESDAFKVSGSSKVKVNAPAGGTAVAKFKVQPTEAGEATYMVSATGKNFKDIEERKIYVRPAGVPHVKEKKGTLERDKAFEEQISVKGNEDYLTGFMSISFPTAVPAIQGLEAMIGKPQGCIDWVSSSSLIAASLYRYLQKYGKDEKALERVGQILQLSLAGTLMSQRDDGGWGWNVNLLRVDEGGKQKVLVSVSNPYMTAQSLEGLLEMKAAGLPVPQDAVTRALDHLASTMDSDNLWDMSSIAIWEGKSQTVKVGMSAEIFKVMAYAGLHYPQASSYSGSYSKAMQKLQPTFEAYLDDPSADVFTMSNAALGLLYLAKSRGGVDKKLDKKLASTANKLLQMRKESHWEPGWFNAWGGTMEATEAALSLMTQYDPEAFEAEIRDSLRYILSTQTSFGDWHNARGTAAAIRALLLVPPTKEEKPSTVRVSVNGQVVREIEINPDDPYLSAIALRMLEITDHLKKGKNKVKVTYDGNLEAPVTLRVEKWTGKDADPLSDAPRVAIIRSYSSDSISADQPVTVNLKMAVSGRKEPLVITEPLPANASVESASLDKLVKDRLISDYLILGDSIELYIAPTKKTIDLDYRITGTHAGKAVQAPTLVALIRLPHSPAYGQKTTLTVK